LQAGPLLGLGLLNGLIVLALSSRWWYILRTLGCSLPYITLSKYRLAAFAVSYFTPGPQFGGEPFQVMWLAQRHEVPVSKAIASVSLDKLLEIIANFSFLLAGIAVVLASPWAPPALRQVGLPLALVLLALPGLYLFLMLAGRRPLSGALGALPAKWLDGRVLQGVLDAEAQMSYFCVSHPFAVLQATAISLLIWLLLVAEYWYALAILGAGLSFFQVVSVMLAARLAFLTPLPGGLGALEAGQVIAVSALGAEPALGISISLLIRVRDLLFGGFGLGIVMSTLGVASPLKKGRMVFKDKFVRKVVEKDL
jgi:uncharacterized protein (TIRG00374 family)